MSQDGRCWVYDECMMFDNSYRSGDSIGYGDSWQFAPMLIQCKIASNNGNSLNNLANSLPMWQIAANVVA